MIITKCAICEKNDYKILYKANFAINSINDKTFSARRTPDKIHYQIVKCKNCNLVYSNPILSYSTIEKLYKKSRFTYGDFESDLSETYLRYLKKIIFKDNSNSTFLEIGCGNGFFLKTAQKIGFKNIYGVEPGVETVKKADKSVKKYIINDIFRKGQFSKETIDLVCLFQVLDHIPDPNSFLKECRRILKKGGVLLCINHDVDSLSAKFLGENSPIFDIEHTYLYSKNTLRRIFLKNSYLVEDIFNVSNRYPFSYWLRMFPLPYNFKRLLLKVLKSLGILDKKVWISAGNIGIVVKKI